MNSRSLHFEREDLGRALPQTPAENKLSHHFFLFFLNIKRYEFTHLMYVYEPSHLNKVLLY